jgi:hypothetical protein
MRSAPVSLLAGLALSCGGELASSPGPVAVVPAPADSSCRVSLASGSDWMVYAADPKASGGVALLGNAQPVCLARSSEGCPPTALAYGHGAPDAWTADRAALGGAVWIWAPGITPDAPSDLARYVFARRIDLARVGPAWLQLAADDFAEVRVNGTRVGAVGSLENVPVAAAAHQSLATFGLAPYLVTGTNTIIVTAQNGPPSFAGCPDRCRYRDNPAGVLFGGEVDVCSEQRAVKPAPDAPTGVAPVCQGAAESFMRGSGAGPGRWSFGWAPALDGRFVPFVTQTRRLSGLASGDGLAYRTPPDATHPVAFFNPTHAVRYPGGTFSIQPGQLALHPGPAGEYAIARWQATEPGRVSVTTEFFGLSASPPNPPTTTDVHVRPSVSPAVSGALNLGGSGNAFRYASTLQVAAGDTIDFAVGFGNGTYTHDSTALDATVCRD